MTLQRTDSTSIFLVVIFLFILAFGLALLLPNLPSLNNNLDLKLKTHAVEVHQTDAELVRSCIKEKEYQTFLNPDTGRILRCVHLENGKWGIQVLENKPDLAEEVTTFIKNKMSSFNQVIQYIKNAGYSILK